MEYLQSLGTLLGGRETELTGVKRFLVHGVYMQD